MPQTIEQKIAETQAKLTRLRNQERQLENGQKIILGGMLLQAAKKDPSMKRWVLDNAAKVITREADKKRLEPLLEQFRKMKLS